MNWNGCGRKLMWLNFGVVMESAWRAEENQKIPSNDIWSPERCSDSELRHVKEK
jgi:hypothetical protein